MRPSELVPGNCYFEVGYQDSDLLFPIIQTLKYVGTEHDGENGNRLWVFHIQSGRSSEAEEPSGDDHQETFVFPDEQLGRILDCAGLIRKLNELAFLHPITQPGANTGRATMNDIGDLHERIHSFFARPSLAMLVITIWFTDDGFSINRQQDGTTELFLTAKPRENPMNEERIRLACQKAGLVPKQDYLADRGRTRILTCSVQPDAWADIAKLATSIFLDAYEMRSGDVLRYQVGSRTETGDIEWSNQAL